MFVPRTRVQAVLLAALSLADVWYCMCQTALSSKSLILLSMIDLSTEEWKQKFIQINGMIHKDLVELGLTGEDYKKEFELRVLHVVAELGKQDYWFFVEHCLMWGNGLNKEFHGQLCDFLQLKHSEKLVLCPRGHLKSTLGTVGYALWRIVRDPDIRILIANYKHENAKAFLHQIKSEMMMNQYFQLYFAYLIPDLKKVKWNENQITVRRNKNLKEATIEVTGVGAEITGKHYDLILFDDVVGPENIGTLEQLQKLRQWYNQMQSILEPGGDQMLIGTRWHFADLYGFLMENLGHIFKLFHREVYKTPGVPLWPEKFSAEKIESIRERMEADPRQGRELFVAQYLNKVIDEATATFKYQKLRWYKKGESPRLLAVSITCDPAISEKESADRTAFVVRGVDKDNNWWILKVVAVRGMTPTETVDKLFELYKEFSALYDVQAVGVEAQSYQKALIFSIRDEMRKRDVWLPLVELGNWKNSKEVRIRGLVPRVDMGAVFFLRDAEDDHEILIDEMMRFPKSAHDDALDALAMHQEIDVSAPLSLPDEPINNEDIHNGRDRYGYAVDDGEYAYGSPSFI